MGKSWEQVWDLVRPSTGSWELEKGLGFPGWAAAKILAETWLTITCSMGTEFLGHSFLVRAWRLLPAKQHFTLALEWNEQLLVQMFLQWASLPRQATSHPSRGEIRFSLGAVPAGRAYIWVLETGRRSCCRFTKARAVALRRQGWIWDI